MAETTQFMFNLEEVLEDLIKRQGLHKGRWKIVCELGFAGINTQVPNAEGDGSVLKPAAMVVIQRIGVTKTEEVSNLTVDAAVVNPERKNQPSSSAVGTGPSKTGRKR